VRHSLAFVLIFVGVPLLVGIAWYELIVHQEPSKHSAFLWEKRGRVVDARTGLGLGGVTIVAAWHSTYFSIHTSSNCPYQKIVQTDATGAYTLPDVSEIVTVTDYMVPRQIGLASMSFHWNVVAYKDGYMDELDAARRPGTAVATSDYFQIGVRLKAQAPASLRDHYVEMADIRMRKVTLTPEETVLYEATLLGSTCESLEPDYKALKEEFALTALEMPCSHPKDELLSRQMLNTLLYLTWNYAPEGKRRPEPTAPGLHRFARLHEGEGPVRAGDVCAALTN